MSANAGSPPDRSWWTMFIDHVVPLLWGTDTTMSPSRQATFAWIVWLIHGGGPPAGPSGVAASASACMRSTSMIRVSDPHYVCAGAHGDRDESHAWLVNR